MQAGLSIRVGVCLAVLMALGLGIAPPPRPALAERKSSGARTLAADVVAAPTPVVATDKRRHVVYEIVLQNIGATKLTLDRLRIVDDHSSEIVAAYSGSEVADIMIGPQGPTQTLPAGAFGAIFVNLVLSRKDDVPDRLSHRFLLSAPVTEDGDLLRMRGAPTNVTSRPARVGPPLHGPGLLDLNGCCSKTTHARALTQIGNELFLSQRFAIDFLRLRGGSTFAGDPKKNKSYFIFGDRVIAAAPGNVVAARNGLPENTPPNLPPEASLETAFGNYVTVSLGDGRFATYGHLHTGSVRVKVGDIVRRGQVLGLVGNTGNSSEAHLHFQVTDANSGFASNGLPFVLDRFAFVNRVTGLESGTPSIVPADPPRIRERQLPLNGDIVAFPKRGFPSSGQIAP